MYSHLSIFIRKILILKVRRVAADKPPGLCLNIQQEAFSLGKHQLNFFSFLCVALICLSLCITVVKYYRNNTEFHRVKIEHS
jgi:hypothetical protein